MANEPLPPSLSQLSPQRVKPLNMHALPQMTFSFRFNIGIIPKRPRIYPRVKYIYSFRLRVSLRYDRREKYFYVSRSSNELGTKLTDD